MTSIPELPAAQSITYEYTWQDYKSAPVVVDTLHGYSNVALVFVEVEFFLEGEEIASEVRMEGYALNKSGERDKRRSYRVNPYNIEVRESFVAQTAERYDIRKALGLVAS